MSFINQQNSVFVPGTESVQLSGVLGIAGTIDSSAFQQSENIELSGAINLSGNIFSHAQTENSLFGSISLFGSMDSVGLTQTQNLGLSGVLNLSGTIDSVAKVPLAFPDPILTQLSPEAFSANSYEFRALKDNSEIPIKGFTINASRGTVGKTVSLDLATKDLSAADIDSLYKFEIGKKTGVYELPEWTTILNNARLDSRNYSRRWLNDSLSFGISSPLEDKLNKFPRKNIFISDPEKIENSIAEIEKLKDSNGNEFIQEERFVSALSIYNLFQIAFVEGCGFSGFHTNIPDFEISKCDFLITNSFFDSVKGFIGIFEPLFFAVGNVLWIVDKTQGVPEEFAPVAVSPDKFLSWQNQIPSDKPLDAFLLQFVESKKNSNFFTLRTDTETIKTGDDIFAIGYSEIEIERKYREYRSNFNSEIILRTEQVSEKRTVKERDISGLKTIRIDETSFTYDSRSRLTKQEKSESAPVWNYFEGSWSRSVSPQILRTESYRAKYGSHPEKPRLQTKTGSTIVTKSILVSDAQNQFLGKDFKQQYIDSVQAGNLTENQSIGIVQEPVKTIVEKLKPFAGQTRIERIEIDHLLSEVVESVSDVQTGDGGASSFESKQNQTIVFKPGLSPSIRTGNGIESLSVGELDAEFAIPLAERLLERRTRKVSEGTIELLGFSEEIERGVYFRILDRNNDSLGTFVVEGFTVTGTNLGTANQRIATALEVSEV